MQEIQEKLALKSHYELQSIIENAMYEIENAKLVLLED